MCSTARLLLGVSGGFKNHQLLAPLHGSGWFGLLEIRRAEIARLRLIEAPAPPATPFDGLSRANRGWGFVSCRLEPPRSPLWVHMQLSNPQIWATWGDLRERKSAVLCPRRSLVTRFSRANWRSSAAAQTPYEQLKPLKPLERGCLLYTSPSPRDGLLSRMPSSA